MDIKLTADELKIWEQHLPWADPVKFIHTCKGKLDIYGAQVSLIKEPDGLPEKPMQLKIFFGTAAKPITKLNLLFAPERKVILPDSMTIQPNDSAGLTGTAAMLNCLLAAKESGFVRSEIYAHYAGSYAWSKGYLPVLLPEGERQPYKKNWATAYDEAMRRYNKFYSYRVHEMIREGGELGEKAKAADEIMQSISIEKPEHLWVLSELSLPIPAYAMLGSDEEKEMGKVKPTLGKVLLVSNPWPGYMDLTDDSPGLKRFKSYAASKGIEIGKT